MTKRKYYDMDAATLNRVRTNIYQYWVRQLQPGKKSDAWSPRQQADLYFLLDQLMALMSVVDHLNDIVQAGSE